MSVEGKRIYLGVDPGHQIDNSLVGMASGLMPRWVRINFLHLPSDPEFTYADALVNAYQARGIGVVGLIGSESVPGGYNRHNPWEFTPRLVDTTDYLVERFGDRVKHFEGYNEPNDYSGGDTHVVPPVVFAHQMQEVFRRIKMERGRADITLISGAVLSHDQSGSQDADSGKDYLKAVYQAGSAELDWENIYNQTGQYPSDQLGAHFYVKQGPASTDEVFNSLSDNLNRVSDVVYQHDNPQKLITVTEFGWGTGQGYTDEAGQAENLNTAMTVFRDHPLVYLAGYFCLKDFDDRQYGMHYIDGSTKLIVPKFRDLAQLG